VDSVIEEDIGVEGYEWRRVSGVVAGLHGSTVPSRWTRMTHNFTSLGYTWHIAGGSRYALWRHIQLKDWDSLDG